MRGKKAFTLVELLVVIAVIALLLSILIPALRLARDQALRASCASNIHQHLVALMIYADESGGRLPVLTGGNWIWDLTVDTANLHLKNLGIDVAKYGDDPLDIPTQPIFYCPANPMQRKYMTEAWRFGYYENPPRPKFHVIGYVFLWWGPWSPGGIWYDEDNEPAKEFLRRLDIKQPSKAELVLDTTMSDKSGWPPDDYPDGNFAQVLCGGMPGLGNPDCSNHVLNERKAAGGNIGFADGHIEWRPFNKMADRFPRTSHDRRACPIFWW
jgi:prepilin-type N-terminal cleavage/methylation domain-containing protein/prepilin-type processing-associated H-X9-DG protein